jgi:hypothetical protein
MSARNWINEHSGLITLLAIVSLVVALGITLANSRSRPRVDQAWYYDLNTGKLFPGSPTAIAPILAPSNATEPATAEAGVRAYVFSCGSCEDSNKTFVAYVETRTPEAKAAVAVMGENPDTSTMPQAERQKLKINPLEGVLIAEPVEGKPSGSWKWISRYSPAGEELVKKAIRPCASDEKLAPCFPK